MELLADEVVRGCPTHPDNPFWFDEVRLNLPSQDSYDPSLPWVSKVNYKIKQIAGDVKTYVDDKRPTGHSKQHCRDVARRVVSMLCYLGEQDASRKQTWPSLRAGAWSGSVCHTDHGRVTVLCTQDKWDKARSYVCRLRDIQASTNLFVHKELEQIRGFLMYVIRTYPSFTPYLKGIHLTLDSWRPNRDTDGWKLANLIHYHISEGDLECTYSDSPPLTAEGDPRLPLDLEALHTLFSPPHPPRRVICSDRLMLVFYGFADASGEVFGSTVHTPSGLALRYGLWGRDISHQSSNYRELRNLVETVDLELQDHFPTLSCLVDALSSAVVLDGMVNAELFLFTDNVVAEGAFYKGTSPNPRLFDLILHLKQLETHYSLRLHVIHIAGTCMISQGTDALSRGDPSVGVMQGQPIFSFVPLHLGALERHPKVLGWIQSFCSPLQVIPLTKEDWFIRGHSIIGNSINCDGVWAPLTAQHPNSVLLWCPAPTAAEVVMDELALARHKQTDQAHIFVCPCLFMHSWRKRLFKMADFCFYLKAGRNEGIWPLTAHEPLILGILLPYLDVAPWCLRGSPPILQVEQALRRSWAEPPLSEIPILSQLWSMVGLT
jgi:hypothetical protein